MSPIFSPDVINRALTEATRAPAGHGTALIEVELDGQMHAVLAERLNETWTLAGEVAWSTAHPKPAGYVGLRGSW